MNVEPTSAQTATRTARVTPVMPPGGTTTVPVAVTATIGAVEHLGRRLASRSGRPAADHPAGEVDRPAAGADPGHRRA